MAQSGDELAMVKASSLRPLDQERAAKTNTRSVIAYEEILRESHADPDRFWAGAAAELDWMKPWNSVRKGELPHFEYFSGGVANPCANMLDRHLKGGADNRLALIWESEGFETKSYSYRMLYHEVNRFANVLKNFGLKKGDPVAIFLPNLPETVIAVLACFRLGIIFNTVFSGFSTDALRNRIEGFEPKLIITADAVRRRGKLVPLKSKVDEAVQSLASVQEIVVVKRTDTPTQMEPGRDHWWDDLVKSASQECAAEPIEANEPGIVFYTSGTTGKPKGVIHSGVGFLVSNYIHAKYQLDFHPNDVFWCTADVGWLTMHIWGIVGALANGITTIFYDGALDWPHADHFYKIIQKYHVTKLMTAPTVVRGLMRHDESLRNAYDLSSLDTISILGEPLNPEAWHWTYEKLGSGRSYINNMWGQTELGGCPLSGAAWLTPMKPGSCSASFLGTYLDVVDDDGRSLEANVPGNLVVRAPYPTMIRGLWKEPERFVREYFDRIPGCYCTYDLAVKDNDGHIWVIGRSDDVINVAGHRLSTMEIEGAITGCDGVTEAAVIGMPDELKGSTPVAFVILRNGVSCEEMRSKIRQRIESVIGKIAVPGLICFSDVLPKTTSGKTMRRLLRELLTTGTVRSDTTGIEDVGAIDKVKDALSRESQASHNTNGD